ncbi:MAG: NAD(P)-dependent oxidoreductase [Candidatus Kaelpia aquatica]|nr:NAD(P)-dependent oxidoreductase [Candidatus Kaelpia aquatica]
MNVLITGSTGFIGRHLVHRLAKDDSNNVFCLLRSEKKARRYLPPNVKLIYQDIRDYDGLKKSIDFPVDIIFHCAGYVSSGNSNKFYEVNVLGTENICRLSLELEIKKLIHLSSIAVISANRELPLREDLDYKASNPYGESKIEAERIVLNYRDRGLKVGILRPCVVYGEDEPHLLRALLFLLKYRLYPIVGSGENKFHLVYVESVVDSMVYAAADDSFTQEPVFIVDREVLSHREAMNIMADSIGAPRPLILPRCIIPLLVNLPFFGAKFKILLRDRWFSTDRLLSTGFQYKHDVRDSLIASSKRMASKSSFI